MLQLRSRSLAPRQLTLFSSCLFRAKTLRTASAAATTAVKRCPTSSPSTEKNHKINKIASRRLGQISRHFCSAKMSWDKQASEFTARRIGAPNTLDYRVYIEQNGTPISPFHDVPLYANEQQTILNMIVEIPRWTNAKLEASRIPYLVFRSSLHVLTPHRTDLQGRNPEPHQTRHQEGQTSFCSQLLPPQRLSLELRSVPPCK